MKDACKMPWDKVLCALAYFKLPPADIVADRIRIRNLFSRFHHRPGRQTTAILDHAAHLYAPAAARPEQAADGGHAVSKLRRLVKT